MFRIDVKSCKMDSNYTGIKRSREEWNYYCFEIAAQVSLYQNPNEPFFKKYPIKPYPTENQV